MMLGPHTLPVACSLLCNLQLCSYQALRQQADDTSTDTILMILGYQVQMAPVGAGTGAPHFSQDANTSAWV